MLIALLHLPELVFLVRISWANEGRGRYSCRTVLLDDLWLVGEVDLALWTTLLCTWVRRTLGAVVFAPLRGPGTWLWSLALQRASLLLKPLFQDRVCPNLMEVIAISEVYSLLHGELRASEGTMPGASATPTIELPIVRGYYGHRLAHLLVREIWNLLGWAQYIAPVQVVAFQGFLGRFPEQEDAVQPDGCFHNRDRVTNWRLVSLLQGFGGEVVVCCGARVVE